MTRQKILITGASSGLGAGMAREFAARGTRQGPAPSAPAISNLLGVLAQSEAALELLRAKGSEHLMLISSISAVRGMPRKLTTYAASKAAVATLGEGMSADLAGTAIKVKRVPFIVDTETGCRALAAAIEREPRKASVPAWPWAPLGLAMRYLPLNLVSKMV